MHAKLPFLRKFILNDFPRARIICVMKKRKGFTLVETIVTLSILGISFGLAATVVAALLGVQNKASDQYVASKQLKVANDMISDYVSFVSVKTESTSFSFSSASATSVKYTNNSYLYELKYDNKTLSITTNYDGSVEYLKKNASEQLDSLDYVKFEYTAPLNLLIAEMKAGESILRYSYTLRVQ